VAPPPPPPTFKASFNGKVLPAEFVKTIQALEAALGKPVWLLIHGDEADDSIPFATFDWPTLDVFRKRKSDLPTTEIALVIDSPGGDADIAYQLAMVIRRRCGSFTAIVPRWAKSAATLLSLAAKEIYIGEDGQLGPLDVQIYDPDKEERFASALDEVGAAGELEEAAIGAAAASLYFMRDRTKKKLNTLMPSVFSFVAKLHQPLFDKLDSVRLSRTWRLLRIAEQYAIRLLQPRFSEADATRIAWDLVKKYPSHGFVIDREECQRIGGKGRRVPVGLQVAKPNTKVDSLLDELYRMTGGSFKAIGKIEEVTP
jgi:hypothetical protein